MQVTLVKPKHTTHIFNANQKCWLRFRAGDGNVKVVGKHRGKGRYIESWLRDGHFTSMQIDVSDDFARRLDIER